MIPKERLAGVHQTYMICVADDSDEGASVRDSFYCHTREPAEFRKVREVVISDANIISAIAMVQNKFGPVGIQWVEEVIKGNATCFSHLLRGVVIDDELRGKHPELKRLGVHPSRFGQWL